MRDRWLTIAGQCRGKSMFHYKKFWLIILAMGLLSLDGFAQDLIDQTRDVDPPKKVVRPKEIVSPKEEDRPQEVAQPKELEEKLELPKKTKGLENRAYKITYISWQELVDIENPGIADNSKKANFFGNSFAYEKISVQGNFGSSHEMSFNFGNAHIGQQGGNISYQKNLVKWYGAHVTAKGVYRFHRFVTTGLGPILIYRKVEWPEPPASSSIKSGSDLNLGLVFDLRLQLNDQWDIQQNFGTLAFKATTFWSLGALYKF